MEEERVREENVPPQENEPENEAENEASDDENDDPAEKFEGKHTFMLTVIGFAVGLGNFWRFPKVVQENGGGVFFIPYCVLFFMAGVPLLYTELAVGQRFRKGNMGCWDSISKYLKGIGVCSLMVSFFIGVYYNTILSWVIYYMYQTLHSIFFSGGILPWSVCPNITDSALVTECASTSPERFFWYRSTLNQTPSIDDFGSIQYALFFCLVLSWGLIVVSMKQGVQSLKYVVYVTTLLPFAVLFLFAIHTCTLEGAGYGVGYLITPKFNKLLDPQIWLSAATQIFFSLSLGYGGMIGFSGKNTLDRDVETQTWIISTINSCTSLVACGVVFGIRGFKARQTHFNCITENIEMFSSHYPDVILDVDNYTSYMNQTYGSLESGIETEGLKNCSSINELLDEAIGGTGLAFVVFAETISQMPCSPFFAILFFGMLLALGLASMFGNVEGVMNPLRDIWKMTWPRSIFPRQKCFAVLVVISCGLSLFCLTGSGAYWVDFYDLFTAVIPLLLIAVCELIAVGWFYEGGYERFEEEMLEILPPRDTRFRRVMPIYIRYTVKYLTPFGLVFVFGYFIYSKIVNGIYYAPYIANVGIVEKVFPGYMVALGIGLTLSIVLWIPCFGIIKYICDRLKSTDSEHEAVEMQDLSLQA